MELLIQDGPDAGKQVSLNEGSLVMGRDPGAGLQIKDGQVSRRHAQIESRGGVPYLTDLGSANGSFLNSQKLDSSSPKVLKPGDVIRLGNTTFLIQNSAEDMHGAPTAIAYSNPPP